MDDESEMGVHSKLCLAPGQSLALTPLASVEMVTGALNKAKEHIINIIYLAGNLSSET